MHAVLARDDEEILPCDRNELSDLDEADDNPLCQVCEVDEEDQLLCTHLNCSTPEASDDEGAMLERLQGFAHSVQAGPQLSQRQKKKKRQKNPKPG